MKGNMPEGDIGRALLSLLFPLWLGSFFQQLSNTADSVVVGRLVGYGVIVSYPVTGTITSIAVVVYYFRANWLPRTAPETVETP